MPVVTFNGKRYPLKQRADLVVVRTEDGRDPRANVRSRAAQDVVEEAEVFARFPHAGVEVLKLTAGAKRAASARRTLKKEDGLRFAGRVLALPSGEPAIYTENFFIQFDRKVTKTAARKLIKAAGLKIERELDYAGHAYFLKAPEGTGQAVFDIAQDLLKADGVRACHPELVRRVSYRGANPNQWHLKKTRVNGTQVDAHANVEAAWSLTEGEGVVVAIIDDCVDIDHEEFAGSGKVVAPRDATRRTDDPRPFFSSDEHGTACAGVAVANGNHQASGVAPKARLMPIRLRSALGSQNEADAFVWAADHGADVISCSWGPADGLGTFDPLPDSTRIAIDYALANGRNGLGCVITWAAGNGNESVDDDGYASYDKVIAVGACNDQGVRSIYSDKGAALWCCFPSNDIFPGFHVTPGIWTTDNVGALGYSPGDYTDDFGGTSSACPGAAGVAALVLARNSGLTAAQVKQILRDCCVRIDEGGGSYDADGHSPLYGYGRLDAKRAVELAAPAPTTTTIRATTQQSVAIKDNKTAKIDVEIGADRTIKDVRILVDIEHTYRGDLEIHLRPPADGGVGPILLQQDTGLPGHNLKALYGTAEAPDLADLIGTSSLGRWRLEVADRARFDTGHIRSFTVELDV